jgi:hypothetical protein
MSAWLHRLLGRIGRRYWLERIDRALHRAHEQGLIDSWLLHEIDHRIKYAARPDAAYSRPTPLRGGRRGG